DLARARVEDVRDLRVAADPVEQRAAQGRLARADLADDFDEALALLDPVQEVGQRLAMRGGEKQVAGIGRERERLLAQSIDPRVHQGPSLPGPAGQLVGQGDILRRVCPTISVAWVPVGPRWGPTPAPRSASWCCPLRRSF